MFTAKYKSFTLGLIVSIVALIGMPSYAAEQVAGAGGQTLTLNGVGVWKKSRKEIFLSALYLPNKTSSVDEILSLDTDKHLEIRILARKIRPRRFAQILREYIVINNSKQALGGLSLPILEYINMFKDDLKTGDIIAIDYLANDKIQVRINGTLMGEIEQTELIVAILNSWIGQTPVTAEFKSGIMGNLSSDVLSSLLASFSILEPSEGRVAETKSWVRKEGILDKQVAKLGGSSSSLQEVSQQETTEQKQEVADKTREEKSRQQQEEKVVAETKPEPKEQDSQQEVQKTEPKQEVAAIETKSEEQKTQDKPKQSTAEARAKEAKAQENVLVDNAKQAANEKAQEVKTESQPAVSQSENIVETTIGNTELDLSLGELLNDVEDDEPAEDDEPQISAADIAAQYQIKKDYESSLIAWIRKFEKYPVKAYRRKMEGEGRIVVVVDRNGDVLNAEMAESTGKRLLDKGSLNTIKRASPLPKMPDNLPGDSYEFSVPIVYKL